MSIRVMTMIWDTCLYQAGTLNVLLAMADHASDNGRDIYPGMEYLAGKCRQTVRATQECVKRLRADRVVILLDRDGRDLEPSENPIGGRGYRATYRIDLERVQKLQGFHQQDCPDCEHCKFARKTPKEDAGKGEVSRKKGELSRSHIENHQEPSRTSLSPVGSEESEKVASLGEGKPERWPEFRSTVAKTWPNNFPADNEVACKREFVRLTRQHDPDLIIACAGLHGAELRRRQAARGKKAGGLIVKKPSNWLREGDWEGYEPQAKAEAGREAKIATALGNVRRALGDGLFSVLKNAMPEGSLAALDGIGLTGNTITITGASQRALLERHEGKIERALGERPRFQMVPRAGAA